METFDQQANTADYTVQEQRVDAYLAERLLGIYTKRQAMDAAILELPKVHFHSGMDGMCRRAVNALLPPGTERRAWVKRLRPHN